MKISDESRIKQGRSEGTGMDHTAFIRARDIASNGRKTRSRGQHIKRVYTLLSDMEYFFFAVLDFACRIKDIREQVKIPLEESLKVAREKNIKHPTIPGTQKPSVMTTDLVVEIELDNKTATIALNVKPIEKINNRTLQKMELERTIYANRNQVWLWANESVRDPNLEWNLLFLRQHFDLGIDGSPTRVLREFKLKLVRKNLNVDDAMLSIAKKLKVAEGEIYQMFYHLLARKKIKYDYYKRLDQIENIKDFYIA